MHEAQIKNLCQEQIQDLEDRRKKLGCDTKVGCVKGKELDAFVSGTYQSDKNDIKEFIKKQDEINEKMHDKFNQTMIMLHEVLAKLGEIIPRIGRAESDTEKMGKMVDRTDSRIWYVFVAILLMCVGTVAGVWKINSVDRDNQKSTEAFLAVLASNLSGKTTEQILKEHKEKMVIMKNTEGGN